MREHELPTWNEITDRSAAELHAARTALADARDWLNSDWQPPGSPLTSEAADGRATALRMIGAAKALIDEAKDTLHAAKDRRAVPASATPSPGPAAARRPVTFDLLGEEHIHFVLTEALQEFASGQQFEADDHPDHPNADSHRQWAGVAGEALDRIEAALSGSHLTTGEDV